MTSEVQNEDKYSLEVNQITQGIKSLVTNLGETERASNSMKGGPYEGNYSRSPGVQSPQDNYDSYHYNHRRNYTTPSTRNNLCYPQSVQDDLNYQTASSHMRKTTTSGMESRTLNPHDDESLKRISDLSISSSTSYSSQSSTDEINGFLRQTHIAVYKFIVHHDDEISLEVGDAISLCKVHNDSWFEGTNLRTGQCGVFPSRYVSDILQSPKRRGREKNIFMRNKIINRNMNFLGCFNFADIISTVGLITRNMKIEKKTTLKGRKMKRK